MRRVQSLRKSSGLVKTDSIHLHIKVDTDLFANLMKWEKTIKEKVGAKVIHISEQDPTQKFSESSKEKVKDKEITISLNKV